MSCAVIASICASAAPRCDLCDRAVASTRILELARVNSLHPFNSQRSFTAPALPSSSNWGPTAQRQLRAQESEPKEHSSARTNNKNHPELHLLVLRSPVLTVNVCDRAWPRTVTGRGQSVCRLSCATATLSAVEKDSCSSLRPLLRASKTSRRQRNWSTVTGAPLPGGAKPSSTTNQSVAPRQS